MVEGGESYMNHVGLSHQQEPYSLGSLMEGRWLESYVGG